MRSKLLDLVSPDDPSPLTHVWQSVYERTHGKVRDSITAAVEASGIDVMLKLTEVCPGPYGILYVLVVPRGAEPGRYQLKEWLDRPALAAYLERYRAYFEGDGRHNIWVNCNDESLIVYDRHEVLYLYGDLIKLGTVLDGLGYARGEVRIDFPHGHNFHFELDDDQFSIVNSDDYTRFELVAGQDL